MKEQTARKRQPSARISAACEACKKRKTKCSGQPPPCQMCEQLDTPCVIDLALDMRRRTALQRTIEESRVFQDTLNGIISILRSGDGSEIQDLITRIQHTTDDEDLSETLQIKLQERGESENLSLDRHIKEEDDEALNFGSDEEGAESSKSFLSPGLPRKRPLSMQGEDMSRPSINPIQPGSEGDREGDSLASRYLPLISKLRTVSDREATRILHDFRTSPVSTEGVAALNLLDRRQSRPYLSLQTSKYSRRTPGSDSHSANRAHWHPSLQLTKLDLQTPIASGLSQGQWSDRSGSKSTSQPFDRGHSGHMNSGATGMGSASDPGATRSSRTSVSDTYSPSMITSHATQDHQAHQAIYDAMQAHKRSPVLEMFGDLRALGGNNSRQYHTSLEEFTVRSSATIPVYLVQSRLVLEDSPLSKVFTGFRDAARQMIATGTPALDIVNGSDAVVDLFFRERWPSDAFTCSSWACELCRSFGEIDDIVRVGCVFLLTRLMRWMICPTPETYSEIPECQRPTPTQCFVPHMPAIDLHPMPAMRDMLCNNLQDWMTPMSQTGASCNWPFTMNEALDTDAVTGSMKISKLFGEHVSQSANWSLNSYALSLFPELEGKVRIEDG